MDDVAGRHGLLDPVARGQHEPPVAVDRDGLADDGPVAIRYPRGQAAQVGEHDIGLGLRARRVRAGADVAILAIGKMLGAATKAADRLAATGHDVTVWDVRSCAPLDDEMLADAAAVLGPRPAVVARELTKLFETVRRGPLPDLAAAFAGEGPPKGEVVVLIGEATEAMQDAEADAVLDGRLEAALAHHSIKDAAALVAAELDRPKREVYARALALAKAKGA